MACSIPTLVLRSDAPPLRSHAGQASSSAAAASDHRRFRSRRSTVLAAAAAIAVAVIGAAAFVPRPSAVSGSSAAASPSSRQLTAKTVAAAAAQEGQKEYAQYDWQRVASQPGAPGSSGTPAAANTDLSPDDFPDLPDFPGESASPEGSSELPSVGAQVRQVDIPDLPGEPDLLPPAPNPIMDGGLGLWEWTGLWVAGSLVIALIGGLASYGLARAQIDPDFAATALVVLKYGLGLFQVLFLGRVLLTQFPKIDTTQLPWTPIHYTTEWALAPTRAVFKPEAGVDVAPILWLLVSLLASELLTGPSGILMMAKDGPRGANLPPGMLPR